MNLVETNSFLTWLSQYDGRVKVTDPSVQIWADSLTHATSDEVRQAILDHYQGNETCATPAGIRKRTLAIRERAVAKRSALTAGPATPERTFSDYQRHLDRPEFRAQMLKGRDVYRAKLRARGITPHNETCTTCARKES